MPITVLFIKNKNKKPQAIVYVPYEDSMRRL